MSQELHDGVLDLIKQKELYPYEYMSDFEKFKEESPSKDRFYCSLKGKEKTIYVKDKLYDHVFKAWNIFEMKTMKDYQNFYLKYNTLLLADVFEIPWHLWIVPK